MTHGPTAARRMADIAPFHVMELLARARELEAAGRSIIHLEVGEPDFVTAAPIIAAGRQALDNGDTHYTPALGLPELRRAIAAHYAARYALDVDWRRVVVTPGASGALQLVIGALIDPGDEVLISDPGYPCNRNFVRLFDGRPVLVPVDDRSGFRLLPAELERYASARTRALLLASPSNPTGTLLSAADLQGLYRWAAARGVVLIVDEIYHGLVYDGSAPTALALADDLFVINSFSKYFGMTGWRLGWVVAPESMVPALDRLAQNIFLAAPTIAQRAALHAFGPDAIGIMDARRDAFRERRDYLLPALRELGFEIHTQPAGAFYIYAGCARFTEDSFAFCHDLLENAGVAITPGRDFGEYQAATHVRFAYTTALEQLQEGVRRLGEYLNGHGRTRKDTD